MPKAYIHRYVKGKIKLRYGKYSFIGLMPSRKIEKIKVLEFESSFRK